QQTECQMSKFVPQQSSEFIQIAQGTFSVETALTELHAMARQIRGSSPLFRRVEPQDFEQCAWEFFLGDFKRIANIHYNSQRNDLWRYLAISFRNHMLDQVPRTMSPVTASRPRRNDSAHTAQQKGGALALRTISLDHHENADVVQI